jgi:hypothetical protein
MSRRPAFQRVGDKLVGVCGGDMLEDFVVHHHGRRFVAPSETRDRPHVHGLFDAVGTISRGAGESRFQALEQPCPAVQVAAHVGADAHFRASGRLQIKMGVEAGHALKLVEWNPQAGRHPPELLGREVAMPSLDGSQLVKNWGMMR